MRLQLEQVPNLKLRPYHGFQLKLNQRPARRRATVLVQAGAR